MSLRVLLFDVYGTLLDVGSAGADAERLFPGHGKALSQLWRERQLQYSWLRTLSGAYEDFRYVTADALDYATEALGLPLTPAERERLMSTYERLTPFAEVVSALATLSRLALPMAVLSNGTLAMLEAGLTRAGLRDSFDSLISVDAAHRYKPAPEAYNCAVKKYGLARDEFLMVSSNGWDIAGAARFGFQTFWVNRAGLPVERLGVEPSGSGRNLEQLPAWLDAAHTPT